MFFHSMVQFGTSLGNFHSSDTISIATDNDTSSSTCINFPPQLERMSLENEITTISTSCRPCYYAPCLFHLKSRLLQYALPVTPF